MLGLGILGAGWRVVGINAGQEFLLLEENTVLHSLC